MSLERKTVGEFEVFRRLTQGAKEGFELWEAHRATDGQSAELLTVAKDPSGEAPERRKVDAFLWAAEAWEKVKHPALLECYEKGILDDGRPYILSERRPEDSLDEFWATGGPMNLEAVRDLLMPVIEAAGALHAKGGFHGDISPEAIFIPDDDEAQPKLGGFGPVHWGRESTGLGGISLPSAEDGAEETDPAAHYQSPERRRGSGSMGAWSDVYSLAAMIHRAITGEAPKPPSGFGSLSFGSNEGSSEGGVQVPQPIESLVDKAMSELYMSRPGDCRALAAAMKDAFKKVGVSTEASPADNVGVAAGSAVSAASSGGASVGSGSAAAEVFFGSTEGSGSPIAHGSSGAYDFSDAPIPKAPSPPQSSTGRAVSYGSSSPSSPSSAPSSSSGGSAMGKVFMLPVILSVLGVGGAVYFILMSDSAEPQEQVEEVVHEPTSQTEPGVAKPPRNVVMVQNDSLGRTKRLELKNKLHRELQSELKGVQVVGVDDLRGSHGGRVVVTPGSSGEGREGGVQVEAPADRDGEKGRTPEQVAKKVLLRHGKAFRGCAKRHGGSGVVKVQVVVGGKTGKARQVRVRGGLPRKARKCIQQHIQKIRFPEFRFPKSEKQWIRLNLNMQF